MTRTRLVAALLVVLTVAAAMRFVWLRSDPPVAGSVGIVWHDEGAWVHNARNKALFGEWRADNWNPVFIAPVFTALEYASFEAFGVGTWQARVVPAVSGLVAIIFLMTGLRRLGSDRAAVLGGLLLSVNYAFVMWNRAALMESTMTMWIVIAWAAYACSDRRTGWAVIAGAAAAAAWFTKASAAFFIGALVVEALTTVVTSYRSSSGAVDRRPAFVALASLALGFVVVGLVFVLPNWTEYRFYNWQMTVTRKPDYTIGALADRATWIPIVQSIFSRMWIELALGSLAVLAIVSRWTSSRPAERLLVLWIVVGLAELVVHDSGNERRYVMFIPALVALAALVLDGSLPRVWRALPPERFVLKATAQSYATRTGIAMVVAASAVVAFVLTGSALRPLLLDQVNAGHLSLPVRLAAAAAIAVALVVLRWRHQFAGWLNPLILPQGLAIGALAVAVLSQVWQYAGWANRRAEFNYSAAVAIGRELPPGTLVQGKLANGLSLESQIRPLFVGNGFGNYEDRLRRDDARYILTYDLPRIGYESSDGSGLIQGILEHYPRHRIVDSFVVDETPLPDRAVLIDKLADGEAGHARD
jgi:4-amino-4-deoxy-L-arabinose transferase-like glycosyltransferase